MPTATSILVELKSKGKENTRKLYAKHGMDVERVLGVSVADLKAIAKTIKKQQALACELYSTNIMDAMYLAGMVADGSKLTRDQLNAWVRQAGGLQMIGEYTVPWMTVEHPQGRELAVEWIGSKTEHIAVSGWASYSGLLAVTRDEKLDLAEVEKLLNKVAKEIHGAPNQVRHAMNSFVMHAGMYVKPLSAQARVAAEKIGEVTVDMGDTACREPLASAYIAKMEAAGKVGIKKKTIRC